MSDSEAPKQVDNPDYHNENHTAVQTCGWTKNAMRGRILDLFVSEFGFQNRVADCR
jgi:hypothetical protein